MTRLKLDEARRERLIGQLQTWFRDEFDQSLSAFQASETLDFFLKALGPPVYNQAVQDARKFMQAKLDDLDGEVHEPDLI